MKRGGQHVGGKLLTLNSLACLINSYESIHLHLYNSNSEIARSVCTRTWRFALDLHRSISRSFRQIADLQKNFLRTSILIDTFNETEVRGLHLSLMNGKESGC